MIKRVLLTACMAGMLLSAGCLEMTTLILVKKDGSGVVSETTYMGKALTDMMNQMAAGFGGEAGAAEKPSGVSASYRLSCTMRQESTSVPCSRR